MSADLFLTATPPLSMRDAVAAIITTMDGRYLVQLRDDLPGIWYPGHWGCFGGAVDAGETPEQSLRRELQEELQLDAPVSSVFTQFDYDLRPIGQPKVFRLYYEVRIAESDVAKFVLGEGAAMELVPAAELLINRPVTPYDAFAIWMHAQQHRLCRFGQDDN